MAFENITLEKGMYGVPGKNFTQVLEELDGSQNYAGTAHRLRGLTRTRGSLNASAFV